ncbi:MAG: hypothetical protein JSS81_00005 [Acidobacteria bacterium]|nr:hypothetical protein [Acidobacteriota bacterium]
MIGFNITATSNVGFSRNRGGWTEGSLWFAKAALSKTAPKGTGMFTPDLLGAIEAQFGNLKDVLIRDVGGVGNYFLMNVTGSILMSMTFRPETPANIVVWKLLNGIGLNNTELGDQVMIQLCKMIVDFDEYLTLKSGALGQTPLLTIDIEL